MSILVNKWIEKEKRKRASETAPAFDSNHHDSWVPKKVIEPIKRHTSALKLTLARTLRGTRK